MPTCTLNSLLSTLESIAPSEGAAEWDNTGLLLQGSETKIRKVLITLDLTPAVAQEAIRTSCQAVISYHPPIFSGLRKLTEDDAMEAGLLALIRKGIHVISPHTALDAAEGGLTDWLVGCFESKTVVRHEGSARIVRLKKARSLESLCTNWQAYLKAPYLRVSTPAGRKRPIKTLAICPGAGASALEGLEVDAVLTGEMKHHDVLEWQRKGTTVILSEHGHTERPYLPVLRKRLAFDLPEVTFSVSRKDREPLALVNGHA
jgi:dinuclear metal center YbgI/SA1388 family protein